MNLELTERVALVTGGSRGLGRATALLLASEGARVAVTYRQHRVGAARLVERIEAQGGQAISLPLDLGSSATIREAVGRVLERWGRLDILINNAVEWGPHAPADAAAFEDVAVVDWREPMRVNVEGTYELIQAALPSMRAGRWGRIVTVSSVSAVDGLQGAAWYSTAKSALHGLTRTLAKELGRCGILANVVMPGLMLTPGVELRTSQALRDRAAENSLIGRVLAPEEVARTIVFLASPLNVAITGEMVRASGGRS